MTTVCETDKCTGCMACLDACSRKAITIKDDLFNYNAVIDNDKCISCGMCVKSCHVCNNPALVSPILWKQGWAIDDRIRSLSSSGGFATAIEYAFTKQGGFVCSCIFEDGEFKFCISDHVDIPSKYAGSKYIKSSPADIYKRINKLLSCGEKVLFVGLPCQVAAIKTFTNDHINLYTIDLICHGTPSPRVLDSFLKGNNISTKNIKNISFRTKNHYHIKEDDISLSKNGILDYYTMTFLNCCIYTDNCYNCRFAQMMRVSDLTLGDSWGSELPDDEKSKGVSLALCQNEKGKILLFESDLHLEDVDIDKAVSANHQLSAPSKKHPKHTSFLNTLKMGKSFNLAVLKCFPKRYIKDRIKTILISCHLMSGGVNNHNTFELSIKMKDSY